MPAEDQTDAFTRAIEAKGWSLEQGGADPFDAAIEAKGWSLEPLGASGPEKVEEESDDTSALGQAYRSFVTGITGTFASFPESLGIWAYNMERKYNPDAIRDEDGYLKPIEETRAFGIPKFNLYNLGQGIREATEYIVPDQSEAYGDSFLASDVPQGLGSAVGFMFGGRGIGAVGRNMMGGSGRIAARHMRNVQKSGGVVPAASRRVAPGMAREADKAVALSRAARTESRLQTLGVAASGIAVQAVEGWEDAYGTLLARARAEGRTHLTDRELDMAWSSYKWNIPGGAIEALGANAMALKLFKNLDKGTEGLWGRALHSMIRNGKWRDRFRYAVEGTVREAAQESVQTAWMNLGAAEIARYDENRKLYEHVVRAGGAGGVVGMIFGLATSGITRKAKLQRRIYELQEEIDRLENTGNTLTANAKRREIMAIQAELSKGIDSGELLQRINEAEEEFQKQYGAAEAKKHEADVALTSEDYIQNEDGTVSIPLGDGWVMTTTAPATMEETAGKVPAKTEEVEVLSVTHGLQKKLKEVDEAVTAMEDHIERLKGKKNPNQALIDSQTATLEELKQEYQDLEDQWEEARHVKQKEIVEIPAEDVRFKVTAPTGTTFGEMSRKEALEFVKLQRGEREEKEHPPHPQQAELEERQRQYEAEKERRINAAKAALTQEQEDRYTGGIILVPIEAEESAVGGVIEDGKKVRPDADEVGRLTKKFEVIEDTEGLIEKAGEPVAEPDVIDAAIKEEKAVLHNIKETLNDPRNLSVEEIKRLRVLRAEAQEKLKSLEETLALGGTQTLMQGGAGLVVVRDLNTGEVTVVNPNLYEERTEAMDVEAFLQSQEASGAVDLRPEREATELDYIKDDARSAPQWEPAAIEMAKARGFINAEGHILEGGMVEAADGKVVTELDVLRHSMTAREKRVELEEVKAKIQEQVEALATQQGKGEVFPGNAQKLLDRLNQPDKVKERGGIVLDLETLIRAREILNQITRASNEAKQKRHSKRRDEARETHREGLERVNLLREMMGLEAVSDDKFWFRDFEGKKIFKEDGAFDEKQLRAIHKYLKDAMAPAKKGPKGRSRVATVKGAKDSGQSGEVTIVRNDGKAVKARKIVGTIRGQEYTLFEVVGETKGGKKSPNHVYLAESDKLTQVIQGKGKATLWVDGSVDLRDTLGELREYNGFIVTEVKKDGTVVVHGTVESPIPAVGFSVKERDSDRSVVIGKDSRFSVRGIRYRHERDAPGETGRSKQHKYIDRQQKASGLVIEDGALQRDRTMPGLVGTSLVAEATQSIEERRQEEARVKAQQEEAAEHRKAEARRVLSVRRGKDKGITIEGEGLSRSRDAKYVAPMTEAFVDHVLDVMVGSYSGAEVHTVRIKMPRTSESGKAGDAVWVDAAHPGVIFVNPKVLKQHYKLEEGKLVPLSPEGRSIESVAEEELIHLLDLQVIRHVLEELGYNPRGIRHVSSYLQAIYETLSTSQIEYITGTYAPRTKTLGHPGKGIGKKFFNHPLTPQQVAMEALRMMRDDHHAAELETLMTARGNRLWHEYYKGVRSFIRKTMKSLGVKVTDEHGARNMPNGLAMHLKATEEFLKIDQTNTGREIYGYMKDAIPAVWETGQMYKLTIPRAGGESTVHYFPRTEAGYDAALKLAEMAAANYEGSNPVAPKDMITEPETSLTVSDSGNMSEEGEAHALRLSAIMSKSDSLIQALDTYKLEGEDYAAALKKFEEVGWVTDPENVPEEFTQGKAGWGLYVRAVAYAEAEKVWGEGAHDSMESLRSRRQRGEEETAEATETEEVTEEATAEAEEAASEEYGVTSDGYYTKGEHIEEAIAFYEQLIARHVLGEIQGVIKVRRHEVGGVTGPDFGGWTRRFDATPDGEADAIEFSEHVMKLKLVMEAEANSELVAAARDGNEQESAAARDELLRLAKNKRLGSRQKEEAHANLRRRKVNVRGEGKSGISIISMRGTKSFSNAVRYATAFRNYLNASKREGERKMDAGRLLDENGNFSEEQLAKVLEEAASTGHAMQGTSQAETQTHRLVLAATLRNYDDRMEAVGVANMDVPPTTFATKEEAEAYVNSIEWAVQPEISEEVIAGEEALYSVEEEQVVTEEGHVYMGEEETAEGGQRSVFRKRMPAEKTTSEKTVRKAVRTKEPDTSRWVVHSGSTEIVSNSDLYLTEEELLVAHLVLAPELGHGRTLEEAAEKLNLMALKEDGRVKQLFDDNTIQNREIYQYNLMEKGVTTVHILDDQGNPITPTITPGRVVYRYWMKDTLSSAVKKLAKIDRLYSESAALTFGASMEENANAPSELAKGGGSNTDTESAPVSDRRALSGWRWRPSEWSATDALRKVGLDSAADALDSFYNKEQELMGEYMNGYNVLRKGGVMMAGIDQHGNYRGIIDPKERKQQKRHNIEHFVTPGAFFHTKEQALQHAAKHGWKKVSWTMTVEPFTRKQMRQAEREAEAYFQLRERSVPAGMKDKNLIHKQRMYNLGLAEYFLHTKASEAARMLVAWQKDVGVETSNFMRDNNLKVFNPESGTWSDVKLLGSEHYPRLFSQRTWDILSEPQSDPEAYERLLDAMVENGNAVNRAEAKVKLQEMVNNMQGLGHKIQTNDFMANMEKARHWRLPDEFYDTSVEAYITYLRRFTTRAAQIHAFGQGIDKGGNQVPTLLEKLMADLVGKKDKEYVQGIINSVYGTNQNRDKTIQWLARWGLSASTVAYLSGPLTAVRNSLFAMRANAETFGILNSLTTSMKALWQVITPNMKSLRTRVDQGDMDAIAEASALGMLKHDVMAGRDAVMWEDDSIKTGTEAKLADKVGKVRHWALVMNRKAEEFNRAITLLAARQHLRRTQELSRSAPDGDSFAKHLAVMQRAGIKPDQIDALLAVDEKGHWKPEPAALHDYLRTMVNEKQYGYNLRQHPLWMDGTTSRILFQFQKWGFQRARDYSRNVWRPAYKGTVVTMPDGSKKKVRDVAPLFRNLFLIIGQGELYATLFRALFYDDERKEVVVPASEAQANLFAAHSERMYMNLIYDGGLGIFGDWISALDPMDTRPKRWKEFIPVNPPVVNLAKDSSVMVRDIHNIMTGDQNYQAKGEAVVGAVEKMIRRLPLIRATGIPFTDMRGGIEHNARRWMGIEDYESRVQQGRKDAKLVRTAARRFAKANGYDEELVWHGGKVVHSEKRELYGHLYEALLAGDVEQARIIRDRLVEGMEGVSKRKALNAIRASVRGRQPIAVDGKQVPVKEQREFLRWVKKELPDYEERIKTVHDRYWQTARRARLK